MADSSSSHSEPILAQDTNDLDRLIGLCDEISALVRTGQPLEPALLHMGKTKRGQLGQRLQELAKELGAGKSLAQAVQSDPTFPPVFATVIQAGLESGNLASTLDSVSESVSLLRDTRLFILRSLLYPLILFTSLWIIFAVIITLPVPHFTQFYASYQERFFLLEWLTPVINHPVYWAAFILAVPGLLWLCYFLWYFFSSRGAVIQSLGSSWFFRFIPWIGTASRELQKACFAKIFALLLRASLPLDQSILLAAKASNDQYWSTKTQEELLNHIIKGNADSQTGNGSKSPFSSLIEWSLGIKDKKVLLDGIDLYAQVARNKANLFFEQYKLFLPPTLTLILAIAIGFCYCITIFWPFLRIIFLLTGPEYH